MCRRVRFFRRGIRGVLGYSKASSELCHLTVEARLLGNSYPHRPRIDICSGRNSSEWVPKNEAKGKRCISFFARHYIALKEPTPEPDSHKRSVVISTNLELSNTHASIYSIIPIRSNQSFARLNQIMLDDACLTDGTFKKRYVPPTNDSNYTIAKCALPIA